MEVGVPSNQDIRLHNVLQQKSAVEKNLELAKEEAEDPETDPEVQRWRFQLKAAEKGLQRIIHGRPLP